MTSPKAKNTRNSATASKNAHSNNTLKIKSTVNTGYSSGQVGATSLLVFTILLLAWLAGFLSRLFAVIRFESIIHEFDPW